MLPIAAFYGNSRYINVYTINISNIIIEYYNTHTYTLHTTLNIMQVQNFSRAFAYVFDHKQLKKMQLKLGIECLGLILLDCFALL